MSASVSPLASREVLGTRVDATSFDDAVARVCAWARGRESRYVCAANVHMVMEGHDEPGFQAVVNGADLVTPDGVPLVWMLRALGVPEQARVDGPELTLRLCAEAARSGLKVGFYGSTPETLAALVPRLKARFPGLEVAYALSPPFRQLTESEDAEVVAAIAASGTQVLFVGLGCPKQEKWMARMRGRVPAVMLGVGAAFDFHAGKLRKAPDWMQRAGLEWTFRLAMEPRRLARRYAVHNPRFVALAARQLLAAP